MIVQLLGCFLVLVLFLSMPIALGFVVWWARRSGYETARRFYAVLMTVAATAWVVTWFRFLTFSRIG